MNKIAAIFLIVSFIGVAVFGFAAGAFGGMHDMSNSCIAKTINGSLCPKDVVEYVSYHISAFNSFFSVIASQVYTGLLGIALPVIGLAAALLAAGPPRLISSASRVRDSDLIEHLNQRKFSDWLSLLENSPSV